MSETATSNDEILQKILSVSNFAMSSPPTGSFNLNFISRLTAGVTSSQYMHTKMLTAEHLDTTEDLIDYACRAAKVEGLVLEFGVFSGRSINRIAENISTPVYGFDSFEGLPEAWRPGFDKGAFAREGLPQVLPNVELVVGWFDRTLPAFLDAHQGPASLIHVDCDLYSSTQTVFTQLRDRIVPGTIILFDEYFNYPGWELHEYKAFQEFVETAGVQYDYIGLNVNNQQVAVRVNAIRPR